MVENSKEFLRSLHTILPDELIPVKNDIFRLDKIPCCYLLVDTTDNSHIVKLNDTGSIIWGLCSDGRSVGDIVSLLSEAYEIPRADMLSDVSRIVEYLLDEGALTNSNNIEISE